MPRPRQRCQTGCITCRSVFPEANLRWSSRLHENESDTSIRIRRVKCDEAKPSCTRCTSTGRKCDGYQGKKPGEDYFQTGTHHHTLTSTISSAPGSPNSTADLRALQYFQQKAAPALAASFDSDFWNTIVLQVSDNQTPVRSAVIAFSSLHESFERGILYGPGGIPSDGNHLLALRKYNIAVQQTAQLLNLKDPDSCRVALVSCLLFVCLELLQNNYARAIDHLIAGLRMIHFSENAGEDAHLPTSLSTLSDSLKQFFGRIVVQSMFLADTHWDVRVIPKVHKIETPAAFSSLTEAKNWLDSLFLSAYPFLHLIAREPGHDQGKFYQSQLLNEISIWYRLFQRFVDDHQAKFTPKDSLGAVLLDIHSNSLSLMVDTALDKSKTFRDTPASRFLRIITLVESLLSHQNQFLSSFNTPPSRLPYYSFDLGVIGPLFYTAVKCCDSTIRLKALSLLRHPNIPLREGMYNAAMTAAIAQRVAVMEETFLRDYIHADIEGLDCDKIKEKVWFDLERPTEDTKELKILVGELGEKHRMKERRHVEVVHW
jgi:hypothetical protein